MRTGASLVNNILSVHSDVVVFAERIHFFRFILGKYDPLSPRNVERMLEHLRIRLEIRFGTPLDVESVFQAILARGLSYKACYDEIMKSMVKDSGKAVWGDFAPAGWRNVPYFVNAFEQGRAFHIHRDPRGVLASWKKMTFQPDNLYLNGIFNWIDSMQHIKRYRETLPEEKFIPLRFEDFHEDPEPTVKDLCRRLGLEFEPDMVRGERWNSHFDSKYVEAPTSSHSREKVYGFDKARTETWKSTLEEWEIALIEFFLGDLMEEFGYQRELERIDPKDLQYGLSWLTRNPVLLKHLTALQTTGMGTDAGANDPTDPRNWGATDGYGRFVDSPMYQRFIDEMEQAEQRVDAKYLSGDVGIGGSAKAP